MPLSETRRRELESKLAREISKFNGSTRRRLIELIGDPPSLDRLTPDVLTEIGQNLQAVLSTPLETTFIESANALMKTTGFYGVSTDLINEGASRWSRQYIPPLVDGMMNTRLNNATNLVSRYYDGDFDRRGLIERLSRDYSPAKAEQIAITESTRAANEGQRPVIDELEQSGVVMRGIWKTVRDRRVCPVCEPLNGLQSETTGFETRFDNNGKSYDRPPAHVGCRCLVSFEYVFEEEDETPSPVNVTPPDVEPETVAEDADPTRYQTPSRWVNHDDVKQYYKENYDIEFQIAEGANVEALKVATEEFDELASQYPMVSNALTTMKVLSNEEWDSSPRSMAYARKYSTNDDLEIVYKLSYLNKLYLEPQTPEKGGWMVTDHNALKQITTHEFGHILHYWLERQSASFTGYVDSSGFGVVKETVDMFLRENRKNLKDKSLSTYGLTNKYETFTELFVASKFIPDNKKSAVMKRFDKLLQLLGIENVEQWDDSSRGELYDRRRAMTEEEYSEMIELMNSIGIKQ